MPAEALPFIRLMPLTTHAGVQGKSIGLGDAFQPGIRPVEWADGANHEGFATLLRADGHSYLLRTIMAGTMPLWFIAVYLHFLKTILSSLGSCEITAYFFNQPFHRR